MPCLGCPRGVISYWWRIGLGRIVFFPCGSGIRLRGRAISFRGKVYSSRERIASFPGRKVSNSRYLVGGRNLTVYLVVYWIAWITCIISITCIIIVANLAVKGEGETSRTFGERYKEHLKAPSAIHHHSTITGHTTNHNNFQIIGREGHNLARNIKESIYIRVNNPSLNNNIGKFNLSHIWDRVLINTKGLTLK